LYVSAIKLVVCVLNGRTSSSNSALRAPPECPLAHKCFKQAWLGPVFAGAFNGGVRVCSTAG